MLNEGGRGGTSGRAGRRLRNILVVTEVALAVVVLIGAGLLMRSFLRLRGVDPGFRAEGVLTVRVPLAGGRNSAHGASRRVLPAAHGAGRRTARCEGGRRGECAAADRAWAVGRRSWWRGVRAPRRSSVRRRSRAR